jgi:hypothetical protein
MRQTLAGPATAIALTAMPAGAKPPGTNGQLVFGRIDPSQGDTVMYTNNPEEAARRGADGRRPSLSGLSGGADNRARMTKWPLIGTVAAAAALGTVGIGRTMVASRHSDTTAMQARSVAVEFFRSQNERRYDDTCRLLSNGFIRSHRLRDRRTCAAVMRVAFVWSGKIDFRIGGIARSGDRVIVNAVADRAPGRLVLVREDGRLRILAVQGD